MAAAAVALGCTVPSAAGAEASEDDVSSQSGDGNGYDDYYDSYYNSPEDEDDKPADDGYHDNVPVDEYAALINAR